MPRPLNDREAERMRHSALRQRIMDGIWRPDAYRRMLDTVGVDRARAWGDQRIIDIGTPLLRSAAIRNATLYLRAPYFEHPDDDDEGGPGRVVNEMLRRARWGPLMTGVLQQAIGLNDAALRYEVTLKDDGTPIVRFYPRSVSDLMGSARYDDPSQPRKIYEAVHYHGAEVWRVWGEMDRWLEEPDGSEIADTRAPHGQGRCPWVLWHTTPNNRLWSPYVNAELVDLTLGLAVAETFKSHAFFEAAWPQRYIVNAQPVGVGVDDLAGDTARQTVTADPATVLLLEQNGDGQPIIGQWSVGADPKTMSDSVDRQQRRASLAIGAAGSDVYRASGETRSAYALEITRQNQRTQQVNLAPLCQPSDEWLAGAVALAVNTQLGRAAMPIEDYRVRYRVLSPSMEEVKLVTTMQAAGLIDDEQARLMVDPFADPPRDGERVESDTDTDTAGPIEDVNAEEVSALALNGAQVTAAQGIVTATAEGRIPRASAVAMLESFFVMPRAQAEAILGTVGAGFVPTPEPGTAPAE